MNNVGCVWQSRFWAAGLLAAVVVVDPASAWSRPGDEGRLRLAAAPSPTNRHISLKPQEPADDLPKAEPAPVRPRNTTVDSKLQANQLPHLQQLERINHFLAVSDLRAAQEVAQEMTTRARHGDIMDRFAAWLARAAVWVKGVRVANLAKKEGKEAIAEGNYVKYQEARQLVDYVRATIPEESPTLRLASWVRPGGGIKRTTSAADNAMDWELLKAARKFHKDGSVEDLRIARIWLDEAQQLPTEKRKSLFYKLFLRFTAWQFGWTDDQEALRALAAAQEQKTTVTDELASGADAIPPEELERTLGEEQATGPASAERLGGAAQVTSDTSAPRRGSKLVANLGRLGRSLLHLASENWNAMIDELVKPPPMDNPIIKALHRGKGVRPYSMAQRPLALPAAMSTIR